MTIKCYGLAGRGGGREYVRYVKLLNTIPGLHPHLYLCLKFQVDDDDKDEYVVHSAKMFHSK